ncbi:SDR family NAD(P)-dependent oxidoreductase [Tabrizicola fusiformis]|uniref:SDR family NAD(P)-dependent oxidoreductase n=1 Tax=Tabrizicola sp. SY72 TaxID=2741673 RepID=UPI001573CFB8|nr:SDR family oxidoreductase [Tabrizicola sp. SY72]NTT85979.1 SDR family oxidoreductase [Tabrizicola sp. SY72]
MQITFHGKTALVTGAGSGIGAAIALALAKAGARVAVQDIALDKAQAVAATITAAGGAALALAGDVSVAAEVEGLVAKTVAWGGGLHLLVNNAGIGGPSAPTGDYPLDGWDKVIGVNLNGVFYGLRFGIPAMLAAGGGAIVNIASILGSVGFANAPAYVAAKHAVVGLTKNAGMEYATQGIRVNAIGPAFIDTPLLAGLDEAARNWLISLHPAGRMGTSEEVAALTLFLLSDQASFITGSYHLVDGGYTAK